MIIGAHSIIYSTDPEADRTFLRDVLALPNVDVGHGWLIFGLPPAEVAVHPSEKNDVHEFYLIVDDVSAFIAEMGTHDIACSPVQDEGLKRMPVQITAVASYPDLHGFVNAVSELPRMTRFERLDMFPLRESGLCDFELSVNIYASERE